MYWDNEEINFEHCHTLIYNFNISWPIFILNKNCDEKPWKSLQRTKISECCYKCDQLHWSTDSCSHPTGVDKVRRGRSLDSMPYSTEAEQIPPTFMLCINPPLMGLTGCIFQLCRASNPLCICVWMHFLMWMSVWERICMCKCVSLCSSEYKCMCIFVRECICECVCCV